MIGQYPIDFNNTYAEFKNTNDCGIAYVAAQTIVLE